MKEKKEKSFLENSVIYLVSILGAAGGALQSYMAVVALLNGFVDGAFAVTKLGLSVVHGLAITLGGVCGGLVNFFINIKLLENFLERVTEKPMPNLTGWQKAQYWLGNGVFILTGILFGLTVFAFGPIGALAAVSIAAGVFVAVIMMIQELETWLEGFDNLDEGNKKSISEVVSEWAATLTKGKILGYVITVLNVVALSLLFTLGLATFLMGVGVPALPAVIAGFAVAFTGGAFTEFYFYNRFLSTFCDKFVENIKEFWNSKYAPLGLVTAGINAIVFGVTSYVGIMSMTGLLAAASIAVPPLGVVIAVAATVAVFAGVASFILGVDFWRQRNSTRLPDFTHQVQPDEDVSDTKGILSTLSDGKEVVYIAVSQVANNDSEVEGQLLQAPVGKVASNDAECHVEPAPTPAYCLAK
jgi:hypothetical protein